jgi:hypothetical protein
MILFFVVWGPRHLSNPNICKMSIKVFTNNLFCTLCTYYRKLLLLRNLLLRICYLVVFEIPTLDLSIFTARKQVRLTRRNRQPANGGHVTGQREFEFSGREVPNLDHAVGRARAEPLVAGFNGGASDPSGVAGNDSEEFPGRVPVRFRHAHRFSGLKSLKRNRKKRLLFFYSL